VKWRRGLCRFLSSLTPGTRHRDIADRLTLGTGRWFLENPQFESWIRSGKEGDSRVLCCVGNPGVGKTGLAYVLCLVIRFEHGLIRTSCLAFEFLHRLQSTDNSALAFVYCDHTVSSEQTPTKLIGSLLAQLTNHLPESHPIITELLMRQTEEKDLDLASGIEYIRRIATTSPSTTIRFGADGLDELRKEHRSGVLHALSSLLLLPNVHFLCFGRDHCGIQSEVESCFQKLTSITHLEITAALTVNDRQLFLKQRLATDKDGRGFDEELRTLIIEKLAPLDSTYVLIKYQLRYTSNHTIGFFWPSFKSTMYWIERHQPRQKQLLNQFNSTSR
jgi:hypothetical protein